MLVLLATILAIAATATVIGVTLSRRMPRLVTIRAIVAHAAFPDAMVVLPDGGLLYAATPPSDGRRD